MLPEQQATNCSRFDESTFIWKATKCFLLSPSCATTQTKLFGYSSQNKVKIGKLKMSEGNDICDAEHLLDIEPLERESQELGVIETKQKQIYYGSGRT